jgi:N-sulfoglucosamine sulfohydrolase
MNFRICIVLFITSFVGCKNQTPKEIEKPNILFCIMDDAGIQMNAYGYDWCKTPAFDKLAENGILFTNAYTPNAKCAPSRSSILTGRNSWQLEEAANHVVNFPAKFKTFPEVLRENGWLTASTGKVWGPGDPGMINGKKRKFIDQKFVDIKTKPWANGMSGEDYAANFEAFLNSKEEDKPWLFWYGAREPHRVYEYGSGQRVANKKLSDIDSVPAFWPDNEIIRNDMLD